MAVRWLACGVSLRDLLLPASRDLGWQALSWLSLPPVLTVLAGGFTVWPVYRLTRRLGGTLAAWVASWLVVVSTLSNLAMRESASTVWATLLVACCLATAARLLAGESLQGYLLAGICGGLAAAASWPASLVLLVVPSVWLRARLRASGRRWQLSKLAYLPASILAALLPFLLASAGTSVDLSAVSAGGQVAIQLYLGALLDSLGLPALVLAGLGAWLMWPACRRKRMAWLLPFPAALLAFLLFTGAGEHHDLSLLVPLLAAFLGVGLAGLVRWMQQRCPLFAVGTGRVRGWPCKVMPWAALMVALLPPTLASGIDLRQAAGSQLAGSQLESQVLDRHSPLQTIGRSQAS